MGRLSPQNQLYIAIAIIAVLTLAAVFFGILPLFQEASTLDSQIAAERTSLADAQALLARRQSAKAQSATSEAELMRIANQIPDSPQLPSVIVELQDVANAAGVELQSIAPSDLAPGQAAVEGGVPEYSVVPVNLVLRGDWADLIDYFHRIDRLNRGVRVVSTTFTYVPETEATDTEPTVPAYVEANVLLQVYVMASAASANAQTPPTAAPTAP